jgi:hypothetical protein
MSLTVHDPWAPLVVNSSLVAKSFLFQMPKNLVGLAQVVNEIIGHFLPITEILHLLNDAMRHHEEVPRP